MNSIRVCLSRVRVLSNQGALGFGRYSSTTPKAAEVTAPPPTASSAIPVPTPPTTPTSASSTDTTPKTVKKRPSPLEPIQEPAMQVSSPTGQERSYDAKISKMVDDISRLTLLEVADLNELLKKRLNIPDMPMMGAMSFAAGPAAPQEEEEVAAPVKVQTSFTIKLMKFDDGKKVALIKECKALLEGMNLVQAKKFVESAPCIIKSDIGKDEAEKLQKALEAVGATCEIS